MILEENDDTRREWQCSRCGLRLPYFVCEPIQHMGLVLCPDCYELVG